MLCNFSAFEINEIEGHYKEWLTIENKSKVNTSHKLVKISGSLVGA